MNTYLYFMNSNVEKFYTTQYSITLQISLQQAGILKVLDADEKLYQPLTNSHVSTGNSII